MYRCKFLVILILFGCSSQAEETGVNQDESQQTGLADVISIEITGTDLNYTFSVGIKSPDTGCDQYADWWEVISTDGDLIYRRILAHSHVNEQPFSRSGGPVNILDDQVVFVRAHMNNEGYGGLVMTGSVSAGFKSTTLAGYDDLAGKDPLPAKCDF